ncbi:endonuclease domain-containing protein [Microbacterium sp. RU33B]|uniref:endonuclease domain-containing protein n=1 Tax=Microbacterium sp. RU33B TaxID=1907390 RepID=UPI0027426D71|nr:DUF559 domain-containing protein [Microbacterium sp. RU33B]
MMSTKATTARGPANLQRRLMMAVREAGGVARTTSLLSLGHSEHRISTAVAAGALSRVSRGWVAAPDADSELVRAAREGVVLTCLTQARRLGLWVLDDGRRHVALPPHGSARRSQGARVHWAQPVIPRHPDALTDSIENVLALVAACQPRDAALVVFEAALRRDLVSSVGLRMTRLPPAARLLLDDASHFSDSGLETIFFTRLRWLRVRILAQTWIEGHRVDFLIGERLVVQIDGAHHVGAQRTSDIAHDAALMLLGYRVLRLSYDQIIGDWPAVQDLIMRAVAQGFHRAQ